jgi:hypothetical protein
LYEKQSLILRNFNTGKKFKKTKGGATNSGSKTIHAKIHLHKQVFTKLLFIVLKNHHRQPDANDLSLFYKNYLNQSRSRHVDYYKQWMIRNIQMLPIGIRAEMVGFFKTLSETHFKPKILSFIKQVIFREKIFSSHRAHGNFKSLVIIKESLFDNG